MMRQHLLIGFGGLFLVLAGVPGCGTGEPPAAEVPPPTVTVSHPVLRDLVDQDEYEGRIVAAEKADVRARVKGHLIKILFKAGQMVKKDDPLYEIDPRTYQAALDGANAEKKAADAAAEYAKAEAARARSLYSKNAIGREELEVKIAKEVVAKGDVLKAQAAVDEAELQLGFTKVKAPIDGLIGRTQVDVGNLINAGGGETLLTTVVSVDPIYVSFNVDERALLRYLKSRRKEVKAGEPQPPIRDLHIPVYVALEGEDDYPHKGEIFFADTRLTASTGTIEVRGELSNKDRLFQDGMRARVRVPVGDRRKTLLIPERAVGTDQGLKFVYVVNDEDVADRRDVTLGRVVDGQQVITSGLTPDDWVVVNGIQRVRDGIKVKPKRPTPGDKQPAQASGQTPEK
jgi:RND family efflux transporter MFP subunit